MGWTVVSPQEGATNKQLTTLLDSINGTYKLPSWAAEGRELTKEDVESLYAYCAPMVTWDVIADHTESVTLEVLGTKRPFVPINSTEALILNRSAGGSGPGGWRQLSSKVLVPCSVLGMGSWGGRVMSESSLSRPGAPNSPKRRRS